MKKSLCAGLMLFVATMSACSGDSDPVPANVVDSSRGISVELEWTTGGTTTDATTQANLDLFLMNGTAEVESSANYGYFESIQVQDIADNTEYTITVMAGQVSRKANYTLYVKGDDESEIKSYAGEFMAGDADLKINFLKIQKSGTAYTITKL